MGDLSVEARLRALRRNGRPRRVAMIDGATEVVMREPTGAAAFVP